jgi:catechol 2,3-dioxygenase-like lactoylglutathione lyase family enzyme
MKTPGVNHIMLTVSDLERSRSFYGDLLGFEIKTIPPEYGKMFYIAVGDLTIWFMQHDKTPAGDRFSEFRVGLDHLSFTAPDVETMQALADKLHAAGVQTDDVKTFPTGNKYMAFRDPDNIQLEYWMN